jgi:hypothetical protein
MTMKQVKSKKRSLESGSRQQILDVALKLFAIRDMPPLQCGKLLIPWESRHPLSTIISVTRKASTWS